MPFADELIGTHTALALIHAIEVAAPDRPLTALRATPSLLAPLALRERSDLLRDALLTDLDTTYPAFVAVIHRAATGSAHFAGWLIWPVTSAVAARAVEDGSDAAFDDALALLAQLTSRLSSEFAIRTLLRHDLPRALAVILRDWVGSDDVDIRRLASEGTRAYLPWATRVPGLLQDPAATVPILDALYRDNSEYVRRSVANHLNDLSRDHATLVVKTAAAWLENADENTPRLVGRALRTLVKRGDADALGLLGFHPAHVDVTAFTLDRPSIRIGEAIIFAAVVANVGDEPARLSIDYVVHHRKANGLTTGKTFKLAVRTLEPGEHFDVTKTHSFRVIATRTYHLGFHAIELLVNGVSAGLREFELTPA
jgi:3-methyladenine DNA glycosylase AlkC